MIVILTQSVPHQIMQVFVPPGYTYYLYVEPVWPTKCAPHLKKIQRINLNMSLVLGGRQEEGPGNKGIKYEKQAQKWNEDLEEEGEGDK